MPGGPERRLIEPIAAACTDMVPACRKCSKKLGGGFGPRADERLTKALRRAVGAGRTLKAAIVAVAVRCLDVCPKNAVMAVNARRPGDWLMVPRGTPVGDVLERLGVPWRE